MRSCERSTRSARRRPDKASASQLYRHTSRRHRCQLRLCNALTSSRNTTLALLCRRWIDPSPGSWSRGAVFRSIAIARFWRMASAWWPASARRSVRAPGVQPSCLDGSVGGCGRSSGLSSSVHNAQRTLPWPRASCRPACRARRAQRASVNTGWRTVQRPALSRFGRGIPYQPAPAIIGAQEHLSSRSYSPMLTHHVVLHTCVAWTTCPRGRRRQRANPARAESTGANR